MDMPLGQAPQIERRYREEHGKLVVEWLRQHYEIGDRGHTILKATVFHDYLVMCRTTGIESTTAAVFGRFVKKAFPTVKCSRKGLDGKSLHCYRCLKRINDDSTTTTEHASSEESSPRMLHPAASVDDTANNRTTAYVGYGYSSAGSLEGGSGSDSTDEGYDDELRYTIEELSRAAGDALYSDHQTHSTAIKTGNPSTTTANTWSTVASSAASASASGYPYDMPYEPCTSKLDIPETRSPMQNVNNGMTYYPSQGREYLFPFDPELASPSVLSAAVPMRPTYIPQPPPFDPLDNYNCSTTRISPAYPPQSTFATIPLETNAGGWSTHEGDASSFHGLMHNNDQDYAAVPRTGLTSYTTSFTTTSSNFTTSGMGDILSTKTFYFKPTTSMRPEVSSLASTTRTKDLGMIGEPWTTSNPTPYPIANGHEIVESSTEFFPGRTLTPPFHPVHTTQSCPVHSQPSHFGPIHHSTSSTTSTYRPPMHMRD